MNFEYSNGALHTSIKKQDEIIKELISQINLLKDRVIYLEELILPIPENHEIFYEKIYNPMKKFPYVIDILDNPSSKIDGETS